MKSFGEIIRELRKQKKLPLRTVAGKMGIDQAILSKIERSQRKASRELVLKMASYFEINKNDLMIAWLSDNLVYQLQDEEVAVEALQLTEDKVLYRRNAGIDRKSIINRICDFLRSDGRVSKAWLFGSFARGENTSGSDIDLMVTYSGNASGTLFEYADIKYKLENLLNCRVDLVEEGYVKPFAQGTVDHDKILIYG
jgi:predicted nucleotidyltransferase